MQMHEHEVDTDVDFVRRLLSGQVRAWADLPIERMASSGTDHALYRLGDELAVRLPRIAWAAGQAELEQRWLPTWRAPHLPLEVPVPVAVGEPTEDYPWPWSVVPWPDGKDLTASTDLDRSRVAADLGAFVRALRAIDATGAPGPFDDLDRGVPLANRDAATREAIAHLRGELDAGAVTAAWEAALAEPPWDRPPTVVEEYVNVMASFHAAGVPTMLHAMAESDLREVLPTIAVPTLLLYGELDQRSALRVAEAMHAAIPGSTLIVLPEVGHMANLEAPDRFNAAVRSFLAAR